MDYSKTSGIKQHHCSLLLFNRIYCSQSAIETMKIISLLDNVVLEVGNIQVEW
jgi:hypothetical protein